MSGRKIYILALLAFVLVPFSSASAMQACCSCVQLINHRLEPVYMCPVAGQTAQSFCNGLNANYRAWNNPAIPHACYVAGVLEESSEMSEYYAE
jgi:hypothetical protein